MVDSVGLGFAVPQVAGGGVRGCPALAFMGSLEKRCFFFRTSQNSKTKCNFENPSTSFSKTTELALAGLTLQAFFVVMGALFVCALS